MTSESSSPTPHPPTDQEGATTERVNPSPPLDVLDRILSALLEAVDACHGDLEAVDIDALADRFPRFREAVLDEWQALLVRSRNAGSIGPYLRVREVGKGGMGTVWEAFDPRLKRSVAIKQLKAPHVLGLSDGAPEGSRIEREAAALASLNHPNVVVVYGLEVIDGMSCLVMELVRGASLDKLVKACRSGAVGRTHSFEGYALSDVLEAGMQTRSRTEYPADSEGARTPPTSVATNGVLRGAYLQDVCRSMAGAADGLAYAHGLGLVHRDIKPGNLIMDRRFDIKIADFGLAKGSGLSQLSVTGQFIGTWQYASPEQASMRHEVGPPSDVWSLGVTLYELVTLKLPFRDERDDNILRLIRTVKPPRPRELNPRIPADLDRIIMRCLEKDPTLRPRASALARYLREFADGEFVSLGAVPPHRRLMSLLRRPTRWSTAAMIGILAVVLVLGTSSWQSRRQHDRLVGETLQFAETSVDEVEARHDPADFSHALEAIRRLRDIGADEAAADVARLMGRLAAEQANMTAASQLLGGAAARQLLEPEEELLRARAAFAAGHLQAARDLYEGLSNPARKQLIPRELALVKAFAASKRVVIPGMGGPPGPGDMGLFRVVPARGVGGLPAGAFICCTYGDPAPAWHLFVVAPTPSGPTAWRLPAPRGCERRRVSGVAVGRFREGGALRLLVASTGGHYLADGDLKDADAVRWSKIDDPDPSWSLESDKFESPHVAFFPGPSSADKGRRVVAAWYRSGGVVALDPPASSPRWPARYQGSDVEVLQSVTWNGEPRLILGLGPWDHFSLQLLKPCRGGRFVTTSTVRLGTPAEVAVLHRPEGDLLLVGMMTQETYIHDLFFGRSTPYGWDYGLYLLEEDETCGVLVPVACARSPRPLVAGKIAPRTVDLLGDGAEEVVCGEFASVDRVGGNFLRTRVLGVEGSGGAPQFQPLLWLPGSLKGVTEDASGATILLMEELDESHRVRHRWVRIPR